jgi:hypothetical protein
MYIEGLPYQIVLKTLLMGGNEVNYTEFEFEVESEERPENYSHLWTIKFFSKESKEGRILIYKESVMSDDSEYAFYHAMSWLIRHGMHYYKNKK